MQLNSQDPAILLGLLAGAIILFIVLWNKQRALAIAMLVAVGGYLLYMGVDWKRVKDGHFLNWRKSGLVRLEESLGSTAPSAEYNPAWSLRCRSASVLKFETRE